MCARKGMRVQIPNLPLKMRCSSNGKTPASQVGDRGSTPRRSTVHSGLNPVPVAWRRAGPHGLRAHRLMGGHRPGVAEIRVRLPVGPLREFCSWKVAGYGLPDRFAKAASPRGVRVRIPRLPLRRPDGEEDDHASVLTRSPGFESWSGHGTRLNIQGFDIRRLTEEAPVVKWRIIPRF